MGWSGFGPKVVKELDEFLTPGSAITVLGDPTWPTRLVWPTSPGYPLEADDQALLAGHRPT